MAKTFQDLLNEGQAKVLGIVSIVPMDDWNTDTQYQKLNLVRHNGASYLAKGGSKNVEPGVTQDWQSSWMLVYLDGILSPDGTYPNLTAGRVMHALAWGNKNYDGSSAQTITAADLGLADVYKPQGSVTFANLPATPNESNYGYVWNITNDFTTDSRFIEGAGKKYSAGTNVGVINQDGQYYYDILGNFVDLSDYAKIDGNYQEMTVGQATNAQNAANVTSQIDGHAISDIFESDGVTVKEATQAQRASADEDGNNIPDTYAKQNGTYRNLIAGGVNNVGIGSTANINDYYGADYWGKEYYFGGGNNPQGSPEGISGGHLSVIRAGNSTTIQVICTGAGSDFSGLPTTYQRNWNGSVWTDWEEIVTSDGSYPTLGAGTANSLTAVLLTASDDLNDIVGENYYGKIFNWGANSVPANAPSSAAGNMIVLSHGTNTSVQYVTLDTAESGSTRPTTYQREARSGYTSDWEEIVTADGSYPTLGAGHLAKQLKINTPSAYNGYVKIGTVPFSAINEWQCYNCIMLISGVFRGSDSSTGTPMPTGQIEIETRKYSSAFSTADTKVGVLYGDIQTSDIFYVFESNKDISVYFNVSGTEQATVECEIISEQTGDKDNPSIFVFDGKTQVATAPSGAVYAVNRNFARPLFIANQTLSKTPTVNTDMTLDGGVSPDGSTIGDEVIFYCTDGSNSYTCTGSIKSISGTTPTVTITGVLTQTDIVDTTNDQTISGAKTFTEVIKAASPATDSDSDDVATTEWVRDYFNVSNNSSALNAVFSATFTGTSGIRSLGDSYRNHPFFAIKWRKANSSSEAYTTTLFIPTDMITQGNATTYFSLADTEDYLNWWFNSSSSFQFESSKNTQLTIYFYDFNF